MTLLAEIFQEIISIQPSFDKFNSSKERNNSPEMQRRRELSVKLGPDKLNSLIGEKLIGNSKNYSGWECVGSNGITNAAEIPWIRIFLEEYSPSPQNGFYLTFLFNALGRGVYLTLNQASTKGSNNLKSLEPEIVKQRVNWAKNVVGNEFLNKRNYKVINLEGRKTKLGEAFAATDIASLFYEDKNIPNDEEIVDDINFLLRGLESIYLELDNGGVIPGEYEEFEEKLIEDLDKVQRPARSNKTKANINRSGGQGYGLTKKQKDAVDLRAMDVTEEYYKNLGWKVVDKSKSYGQGHDFEIRKDGVKLFVEVKGSTTEYVTAVHLSPKQVALSLQKPEQCILAIVQNINLNKNSLECKGGNFREIHPWKIKEEDLTVTKYSYKVTKTL